MPGILAQPGVGITGKGIFFSPCGGDCFNRTGELISHEAFVRFTAESLLPAAADAKLSGKSRRNRFGIGLICGFTVIAGAAQNADLIFHLHYDNSVFLLIRLADPAHDGTEAGGVLLNRGAAERGNGIDRLPFYILYPEIGLSISLHPARHIHGFRVFPQAEPEKDQMQLRFPRLADQHVKGGEIIDAFRLFDAFPVDRGNHRIHIQALQPRPYFPLHISRIRSIRVVQFSRKAEKRFIFYKECRQSVVIFHLGYAHLYLLFYCSFAVTQFLIQSSTFPNIPVGSIASY